ncbi:MAG: phosphoglucosamine mutase [Candidatus Thorarchaeota archaeon]|jgi:phosphomannomutase/phosphoglucomutase
MNKMFGTNGIRGFINEELTVDLVLNLGRAIGSVLGLGKIALARDSRMGGEMFSRTMIAGLLSTGCSVTDLGAIPTPTLQFMIPRLNCVAGVMVTASHNPPEFNGIKVMGSSGIEVSRDIENQIETIYHSCDFTVTDWKNIGQVEYDDSALDQYLAGIKSHLDIEAIRNRNLTVVIDCANSVGSLATPQLLRDLGCKVISLNAQLDGTFPGRNPEPLPENIVELGRTVKATGADIGIAHDGDADRSTFVDETGRVLWGDQSLAIIASRVLSIKPGSTLVTPVSSGKVIEDVVEQAGAKIDWTVVGSVDVSHRLVEINGDLGGEENGGVFYPPHQPVRDGAMTAAQIVEIVASEGKTLSQLVGELPVYFSTKVKVPVPSDKKETILQALLELTKNTKRITMDGVKILYDEGWILIRPSGTEPLYRSFAEGPTQDEADRLCKIGIDMINKAIKKTSSRETTH